MMVTIPFMSAADASGEAVPIPTHPRRVDHDPEPDGPSPEDRHRLLRLKRFLRDAIEGASNRSEVGLHRTVVALDGVCEQAAGLALGHAGDGPGERDTLDDLVSKVAEALGERWRRQGWTEVRKLHKVRNLAQHHGVTPNEASIGTWARETDKFVRTLVAAAFGVDLDNVLYSEAVQDEALRSVLVEAERALANGDSNRAFRLAWDAMNAARRLAGGPGKVDRPFAADPIKRDLLKLQEPGLRAQDLLNEFADVARFAPDMAEWQWLRDDARLVDSDVHVFSAEHAQRALSFVQEWVLRWDEFSARFAGGPTLKTAPRTASGGPPRVIDVRLREWRIGDGSQRYSVELQLADLPDDERPWSDRFNKNLNSRREASLPWFQGGWVGQGGICVLTVDSSASPEQIRTLVDGVFSDCVSQEQADEARWIAEANDDERLVSVYAAACAAVTRSGPPHWGDVTVVRDWDGQTVCVSLTEASGLAGVDLGTVLQRRLGRSDGLGSRSVAWWDSEASAIRVNDPTATPIVLLRSISECIDEALENHERLIANQCRRQTELEAAEHEFREALGVSERSSL